MVCLKTWCFPQQVQKHGAMDVSDLTAADRAYRLIRPPAEYAFVQGVQKAVGKDLTKAALMWF